MGETFFEISSPDGQVQIRLEQAILPATGGRAVQLAPAGAAEQAALPMLEASS